MGCLIRERDNHAMRDLAEHLGAVLAAQQSSTHMEWTARPAAVLIPLFERDGAWHVVLTQRTNTVSSHKGQVAFPGGRVDPEDRDAVDTALREAEEEIGLRRADVRVLGVLDDLLTVSQWRITPVVGVIPAAYAFTPSTDELSDIFDVPLSLFADPANLRVEQRDGALPGPPIEVYHFDYKGYDIWGATARILRNLMRVIGD
jgi:8-oxo-dGTP pyrophosphatase MutT (NUDIX family)